MNNIDITLISPPSRSINHYRPPIGLIYVGGYLDKKGIRVKVIDITQKDVVRTKKYYKNLQQQLKLIEKKILNQYKSILSPIVGISCYTPEYTEVLRLAKKIKFINKHVKIIVGGIHPTLYPDDFFLEKNTPIDFEVIGEGEETALELCQSIIAKKTKFANIRGIAYLYKDTIIKTPYRPVKDNLDMISCPKHDLVNMDYYTNASPYAIRGCYLRTAYVLATRGCPSQCTFCVAKKLKQYNGGGRYTRTRSANNLIKEIIYLKKNFDIDAFYFIDDLFTINPQNTIKFCQLLLKNKLNILWGCSSKVSTLNEKIIRHMAESGCIQIDLGIERGSNNALAQINKGIINTDMIKNVAELCHKHKIRIFSNFLVNLPNETKKDLDDIEKLNKLIKPEISSFNIFAPYPGTQIYDEMNKKFTKANYHILFNPDKYLYTNKYRHLLKFSKHNINLIKWSNNMSKKYNHLWPNMKFHLSRKYLNTLLHSRNKINYLNQAFILIKEVVNQKIGL